MEGAIRGGPTLKRRREKKKKKKTFTFKWLIRSCRIYFDDTFDPFDPWSRRFLKCYSSALTLKIEKVHPTFQCQVRLLKTFTIFFFRFTSYLYQPIGVKWPHMTLWIFWFWFCLLNSWAWVHIYGTSHSVMSMAWTCNIMSCEGTYSFRWDPNHQGIDIYFTWSYCVQPGIRTHDPWIARLAT